MLVIGGSLLFYWEGTLPVDKTEKSSKIFIVRPGESLITITNNLEKESLIRNRLFFYLLVKRLGIEKKIQAGDFRLSPAMTAQEVATNLTHGTLDVWVTIIEGLRKEEIADILSDRINIPEIELIQKAKEGYLFPDTYLIPKDADAEGVITILSNNFDKRYIQAEEEVSKKNNLTGAQIVILASIVEKEAKFDSDRKVVADILLRRMNEGHKLQADATVQYALGYQAREKTWWKKTLSFDDLTVDSLFNTYAVFGLPPQPICNPGVSSLKAALGANGETPYLFYMHDKAGKIHYGKNSEEHQRNIDRYLE